ncbi:MAG: hypothetical protein GY926_10740 [bacterium]|nr:hypothetical protein [bacterium]MCP4965701.1 hypothetical protein [bacterium]
MSSHLIDPGKSLCGVNLGDSYRDVAKVLGPPDTDQTRQAPHRFLDYGHISVGLWEDAVNMVVAKSAACGTTPEGISVGAPYQQLVDAVGPLEFDEDMGLFFTRHKPGVWYEVVRPSYDCESSEMPYQSEVSEVTNEQQAWVAEIYVM